MLIVKYVPNPNCIQLYKHTTLIILLKINTSKCGFLTVIYKKFQNLFVMTITTM